MEFNSEQRFIVTGASSGLGYAAAQLLNSEGATVIAIARNRERLEEMKAGCKFPENMRLEIKDLSDDIGNLPDYVKQLREKYGKLSGMAYCAGYAKMTPLRSLEFSALEDMFKIQYFAPIMMSKGMIDKRNCVGGSTSIVYLSSSNALNPPRSQCSYAGAKSALITSAKVIAREVAHLGIRVNTISPSMIKTAMTLAGECADFGLTEEQQKDIYPFGWGEPEDVANMILYLLSDKAKFICGQNYVIDSGFVV